MVPVINCFGFSKNLYLPVCVFAIMIAGLLWACGSDSSSGCSNGTECEKLSGTTYTFTIVLGTVTNNLAMTFNEDGTYDILKTYSGTGAPANCSSSGDWSLNGKALAMTAHNSTCTSEAYNFQYVYEMDINDMNHIKLTSRWLSGPTVLSGNKLWKQDSAPGFAGSYNAQYFSQTTTLIVTAGADSAHGTFQWSGDYTQSGTWQADYLPGYLDIGTCNFTGTAGPNINSYNTYSLTMNTSSAIYTKQ